jgi:hypothetical protein
MPEIFSHWSSLVKTAENIPSKYLQNSKAEKFPFLTGSSGPGKRDRFLQFCFPAGRDLLSYRFPALPAFIPFTRRNPAGIIRKQRN